jgi:hypothetical protein
MIINKIESIDNCGLNNYNRKNCNMCIYGKFVAGEYQCNGNKNVNAEQCSTFKWKGSETFANILRRLL